MKKMWLVAILIIAVAFSMCACGTIKEADYSDGDGDVKLISMENHKVSDDDIEFSVVSAQESSKHDMVKTFKTEYTADDFSVSFDSLKVKKNIYVDPDDSVVKYPNKVVLPQYSIEQMNSILLYKYEQEYGIPLNTDSDFVCAPSFGTRTFTGKLIVTYVIYSEPTADEMGAICYCAAQRVQLVADLYTYVEN